MISQRNAVVASYDLTPLQQGMLVHHLLDSASGVDVEQMVCTLRERVDTQALRTAWERVTERHEVLRTAFRWRGLAHPMQDVYEHVELPWQEEDWRAVDAAERDTRLRAVLAADRTLGFDLASPPLQRFTLLRVADSQWWLLWTFHHAILDGRSFPILLEEAFEEYAAIGDGTPFEPKPRRPYREFVEWLDGRDFAASEPTWRALLQGFSSPTPLPANVDVMPPPAPSGRRGTREHRVSPAVTIQLDVLARSAGVTMNTVLQGAWSLLLSRHSGSDDVVFGATRACRRSALSGADAMVGLFINTLPVRVRVDASQPVTDWLRTLRAGWNSLREVEHTPLALVQGWSEVPHGTGLFDTLLVFENYLLEASLRSRGSAWEARSFTLHEQTNFAITVAVYGGESLTLKLGYDRARITDVTAGRLLMQLEAILTGMVADPAVAVGDVPWVRDDERELVIERWNATSRDYPRDATIGQRFAEMVARTPDAVAVVHGERSLTYRELDARSNQLARRLRTLGVGRDSLVGLCVSRSAEMIVGALGILKAGGAYVTLDPDYPRERLAFMLADSGATVAVTEQALVERLPAIDAPSLSIVCLDADRDSLAREDATAVPDVATADGLAYVIFTSGSTGTPKGVAAVHRGVMRLVCNPDYIELGPDEVLLSFAPLNFDASTLEIWGALLNGGRLVIFPEHAPSLDALADVIRTSGVTTLWLTAALFHQFVDTQLEGLRPLRQLLAGGDVLSPSHVRRVRETLPQLRLVNGYGPTENTTFTCCHTIGTADTLGESVPIGRPVANTTVYILDERRRPLPIGVAGRLYTGGDGLARGYLNRPELTAERFVTDPFFARADARMYDTGDLVRWRADGTIDFLGRADQQLKIRGYRIEPGEVEAALLRHPDVREAVVMGREDSPGDKRLVAYLVPRDPGAEALTLTESVRRMLRDTLPAYMVPSAFVQLDSLPLTSSGKVDRRRLPAPELDRAALSRAFAAPTTDVERALAEIWGQVLRVEQVGVDDNFFELGGDSILMIQILGRARRIGLSLTLKDLFTFPSVGQLATVAQPISGEMPAHETPGIPSSDVPLALASALRPGEDIEDAYALSPMQLGLLYHELSEPKGGAYHVQIRFSASGPLDVDAFRRAWTEVIARHPILRTAFLWENAPQPLQFVARSVALDWRALDWRDAPLDTQRTRFTRLLEADRAEGFDLGRAPLLRHSLVRTSEQRWDVLWSMHHILLDGWSSFALLREVREVYEALLDARPTTGPEARPYRDYIDHLAQIDAGAEAFWRERLTGFSEPTPLRLESQRGRSEQTTFGAEVLSLTVEQSHMLRSAARAQHVTLNTLFQAAWALVLSRYSGDDDVVFGTTVTTRPSSLDGVDRMNGLFLNTLPVRARITTEARVSEWLQTLQREHAEMRAHEATPLSDIQRWSDVGSGTPLFESLLVFENYPDAAPFAGAVRGVTFDELEVLEQPHYPLTLLALPGERITVRALYDTSRFAPDAVARMLTHLNAVLRAFAESPTGALRDVDLLAGSTERQLVLSTWNDTRAPFPEAGTIPRLLAEQAARTPTAVALLDGDAELSYAALDERSNRLARHLQSLGIGREDRVAVCLERTAELVVALIAVLKAGGAYVPLDPEYPAERVAYMLADSGAAVVITQRALEGRVPTAGDGGCVVVVDGPEDRAAIDAQSAAGLTSPAQPRDVAYLIYTSGSTGLPKGVMIEHRSAVAFISWAHATFRREEMAGVLAGTSVCFDLSVFELFVTLTCGGTVVLAANVLALPELPHASRVTLINTVPSAMAELVRAGAVPTSVRTVNLAGEPLATALVDRIYALPHVERVNDLYGPSEDTTYSTWSTRLAGAPATIGRPIANTYALVLDAERRLVPVGVPGELYLGGAGLARGYQNRAELTAERFVRDPFSDAPDARLYRTGDRVRWRADGMLEYLGRFDFQVKFRGFRIELGEIEAAVASHPSIAECVAVVREDEGAKRLVAYFTRHDAAAPVDVSELRARLAARLPAYMVPSALVQLEAMPLTANGKVNRRALPAPQQDAGGAEHEFVAPLTEAEATLARIWTEVLRVERVGRNDNFFELGGDSILSIQIAARARAQGLPVGVSMLGRHPSVAELAAALEPMQASQVAETAPSVGAAPLTPIQRWFFELDPAERDHWNQTFMLRTATPLERGALRAALEALVLHHDVLRLRFFEEDGRWHQRFASAAGDAPLWEEDLSAVVDDALADAIAPIAERAARSLDITNGPCLRVVYMPLGRDRGARLLLVVHHLVVDGISWRILLEDLETAYGQAVRGERVVLPPKSTSFQKWALELEANAESATLLAERPYWLDVTEPPVRTLPTDGPRDASNTVGESETLIVRLDAAETTELLQRVPAAYATQVNDVLLVALADALREWAGAGDLLIDLEGHGRETDGSDLDLTRTIGWFTSVFPVRLDTDRRGDLGERLKAMKEQLRSVPRHGVGYGSLRYLTQDDAILRASSPELVFNYLGQFDQLVAGSTLFSFAPEPEGPWLSPAGRRRYLLDVNSLVLHGKLEFRWTFGRTLHHAATIRRLADAVLRALREIIAHCRIPGVGGRTPSDFPLAALDQTQVDRLVGDGRNVEDITPLVPMQSLFLATSAGSAEVGFEQWRFEIDGSLDVDALRRAWQLMVRRHEILRTTFHAEGVAEPVQVIARQGEIPLVEHDWRSVGSQEQSRRLRELLDADRTAGIRIDRAPLVRLTLVRTGESTWTLVWSNHHLLLDRWSWPIVLQEVGAAYEAIRDGRAVELPPAPAWRHYVRWLAERDPRESEAFWQRELAQVQPRPVARLAGAGGAGGEVRSELSVEETAALTRLARERHVTVNTLASLAWGLWLARATAGSDVVFGLSVAGRPEEVRGIERLVGMCINNVPVRLPVDVETPVTALLARLDAAQRGANEHAYTALTDLQRWSGLPWHQRLFDTLLVFQHHGADDETASWLGRTNHVGMVVDELRTNYPLALVVGGRERMSLRLAYQGRTAGSEGADRALSQLREILAALPTMCDAPARALLDLVPVYDGVGVSSVERARVAPRDDAEWVVARIWGEVLGCAVGAEDNFFDLGGQSLVATQIMSRVQEGFRMELPVSLLFEHPMVESFVIAVRGREPAPGRVDRIAAIIRRVEDMTDQELRAVGVHE